VCQHQRGAGSKGLVPLVDDRKMWVFVVGEAVTGVVLAQGRGELEAHAERTVAAANGEVVVDDYCGKAAILAAVEVVGAGVAAATGEGNQISGKTPEEQLRVE